jgi:hypothetical protein
MAAPYPPPKPWCKNKRHIPVGQRAEFTGFVEDLQEDAGAGASQPADEDMSARAGRYLPVIGRYGPAYNLVQIIGNLSNRG